MKEWWIWHGEQLAAFGTVTIFGIALGGAFVFRVVDAPMWVPVLWFLMWATFGVWVMEHWNDWFHYVPSDPKIPGVHAEDVLTNDQFQFEKYRDQYAAELDGRTDPEFEQLVIEALDRIPEELKKDIPVKIVDDDILIKKVVQEGTEARVHMVNALFEHVGRSMTLYSFPIRFFEKRDGIEIKEWVYRLLMHEFGHGRGYSDAEMKEKFGY